MTNAPSKTCGVSLRSIVLEKYSAYGGPAMPTLGRILVAREAHALKRIEYVWPLRMTISRCRTCASHAFEPAFLTSMQNAPFTTAALPSPGAVNDEAHGRLVPSSKVL